MSAERDRAARAPTVRDHDARELVAAPSGPSRSRTTNHDRREEQRVPRHEEPETARQRREPFVDEPRQAERRRHAPPTSVDRVGRPEPRTAMRSLGVGRLATAVRRLAQSSVGRRRCVVRVRSPSPRRNGTGRRRRRDAFTISVMTNSVSPAAISALIPNSFDSENRSAISDAIELPPVCRMWVSDVRVEQRRDDERRPRSSRRARDRGRASRRR